MLALVRYAGRHRIAGIWLWLAVGLLVWVIEIPRSLR
jgi:hypothetical protein